MAKQSVAMAAFPLILWLLNRLLFFSSASYFQCFCQATYRCHSNRFVVPFYKLLTVASQVFPVAALRSGMHFRTVSFRYCPPGRSDIVSFYVTRVMGNVPFIFEFLEFLSRYFQHQRHQDCKMRVISLSFDIALLQHIIHTTWRRNHHINSCHPMCTFPAINYPVATSCSWNSLPLHVTSAPSLQTLWRRGWICFCSATASCLHLLFPSAATLFSA